jgi:methionyl-tRNA synthetase
MQANGDIYLSKYSGWYSVRDEAYFLEDELSDEPDGTKLAPSGAPVEWVEEESYFFRLSAYADRLLAHYEAHPEFVTPEKYRNEIVAFVKRGLADLSVSRTAFDWGVPVPGDPKHVIYVWVDALTNYLTAAGFPDAEAPRAKFWPADAHVIGKDITRFHAIYWPAFLMSAGLPPPRQVVVHGFLFNRGEKMSKSVGNVVTVRDALKEYSADEIRFYFLLSHYRDDMDLSGLERSASRLSRLRQTVATLARYSSGRVGSLPARELLREFYEAMNDDFDTPSAVKAMEKLAANGAAKKDPSLAKSLVSALKTASGILGVEIIGPK